ncbi:MAG TPA: hypothetical protein VFP19_10425, partial [Candidatus Limnocylindrales bacterium]|nr:hypothetical protein [Candidatus Limnocylindrales bacterium]
WSGTVVAVTSGDAPALASGQVESWRPAAGHLVLDGWLAPLAPAESPPPASPDSSASDAVSPTAPATATAPLTSPGELTPALQSPDPAVGPAGTPVELAPGPIADFDAHFDPTGSRLAVWVLDAPDSSAGRLWLVVLDPAAGRVDPSLQPMAAPGQQALRGFTIDSGRLAWATPAGQDGQPSSVHVLAWNGDAFGQVESVPGGNPQIVR